MMRIQSAYKLYYESRIIAYRSSHTPQSHLAQTLVEFRHQGCIYFRAHFIETQYELAVQLTTQLRWAG